MGVFHYYPVSQTVFEAHHMNKKIIMVLITSSASVFGIGFLYFMFQVLAFLKNPLAFSWVPIFCLLGMVVALFVHLLLYVHFMDMKPKKFKIEDIDEWWKKWDYDWKKKNL